MCAHQLTVINDSYNDGVTKVAEFNAERAMLLQKI